MSDEDGVVTGLGGIFVKSDNSAELTKWYQDKLGFPFNGYSSSFLTREHDNPEKVGYTVWGPFKSETEYFNPSQKDFMINLRVRGLEKLLERLKEKGVEQVGEMEDHEYGKFAWIVDPDGTKIELWEQVGEAPDPNETFE